MIVRKANEADIGDIVSMARRFYATTSYAGIVPLDDDETVKLARMMMDTGTMLVAEDEAGVVGMVGLVVCPFMFNNAVKTAMEVVWWVNPEAQSRGAGKALMQAVEPACAAAGAVAVVMVRLHNSPPQAGAVYESMGYRLTELSHTKEIKPWPSS